MTVFLPILVFAMAAVRGETESTTRVTVQCSQPELVAGQTLRVFAWNPLCRDYLPVDKQTHFTASGETEVELTPGLYCFEVMTVRGDATIVVVQSRAISVPRTTSVTIQAGKPREVVLSHRGQELLLSEVGVRSAIADGQVRWRRKESAALPRIVLTPGKSTCVSAFGSADALHVAVWGKVAASSDATPIRMELPSNSYNCRFTLRDGSPSMRNVTAVFEFPDSKMEIPVATTTRFVTNRRFFLMGYQVELDDGTSLPFTPRPWNVNREQCFEFGGAELTPCAWAEYVWEEDGGKWWPHLLCRVDLLDPGGHRLDVERRPGGFTWTARRRDGKSIPSGRVDEAERKQMGELSQALQFHIEWTWNGKHSCERSPTTFVPAHSQHFRIVAVPAWQWQTWNYLAKVERYYRVLRAVTGRPGPASFRLDWRNNTHNAKAIVAGAEGGGKDIWCSLPFRGYENNHDPFNEPWFLGHELLHTFGYHHGNEMTQLQKIAEFQFARYRWHVVDNPRTAVEIPGSK